MRQILFHIPLDRPLSLGPFGDVPIFGVGLLLFLWSLFLLWLAGPRFVVWMLGKPVALKIGDPTNFDYWSIVRWTFVAACLMEAPLLGAYLRQHGSLPFRDGIPIFGYGFMLFVAVASGGWWATRRAERQGVASEKIWDLAFCLFLSGIAGARVFYLVQYRDRVFENVHSPAGFINAVFNLSNGGIVLYGGLIAAAVGYFTFCHVHRLRPLAMLDIITPSIFLGIGFGRIGCFLNGCCYGDESHLPWAVQFPRDSATFGALVEKGLLSPDAFCTMPLHPTQIYSAIDGFVIATITAWYFARRRRNGEVFAIGLLIYPVTRFLIEFIRGDEPGLFGTRFTISQWISAAIFLVGIAYMTWLSSRPAVVEPACTEPAVPPPPASNESRSSSLSRAQTVTR